jgi:hypothetical protein
MKILPCAAIPQIIRATTGILRNATTSAQLPAHVPANTIVNLTKAGKE